MQIKTFQRKILPGNRLKQREILESELNKHSNTQTSTWRYKKPSYLQKLREKNAGWGAGGGGRQQ